MPKAPTHLKLRQIEVFLEAARHSNFASASKELGVSPGALSQAVADLEKDLGGDVRLFDRTTAGVTLTRAGEVLLEHARLLLSAEDAARLAVRNVGNEDVARTRIRVAYAPELAAAVSSTIEAILWKTPHLDIDADEVKDEDEIERQVENGVVDVGMAFLKEPRKPQSARLGFCLEPGAPDAWKIIASERHPLRESEQVSLRFIEREPLAIHWLGEGGGTGSRSLQRTKAYLAENNFTPRRVVFNGNGLALALALVRAGLAVTLLNPVAIADRSGLCARRLYQEPPKEWLFLATKEGEGHDGSLAKQFAQIAAAVIENIRFENRPLYRILNEP